MLRSLVSASLLLAASPALAAVDTFVDFGGAILGESTNINYLNWIELSSFNLEGYSKAIRDEATPARVTQPPKFTSITMTKTVDSTTGELMAAFLTGDPLPTTTVEMASAGGLGNTPRLTVTLTAPVINSHQVDVTSGDDVVTETFTLTFTEVCVTAYDLDVMGNATPRAPVCYDVLNRAPL